MIYLSKGIVQKGSTEQLLFVLYGGQKFELTGNAAAAWLNGRFKFAEALGRNEPPVAYLQKLGLAETETDNDELSRYRITSRCIFCPADTTLTADSLNDLILAALGLDRRTYELELDPGEVDAVRQGDYGKLSPGDRIETELTAAVRNSLTGQSTQRRKLPLILGRSEDIPEEMYPEFYYKIKLDGTAEITDYVGNDSIRTLTVPSSLGGVKVTSIGELAFSECRELEAVTIPKTVTRIGERAFALCTSLDGVSIPDSVTEVGRAAFYYCTSLKGVRLPSRLRYIPDYMFYMCTSLENVLPPEELREIGAYAFCCCKLSSFGFGDGIERIGDYSFEGCALRSVRVPDTCDYVGNWSFYNCASLSDVYLGRGLTQLGSGIFYGTAVTDVSYGGTASEYSAIVKKSTLMGDQKIVCEGGNR